LRHRVKIVETYRQQASRLDSQVSIVGLGDQDQRVVLDAIQGCITGGEIREQRRGALDALVSRLQAEHGQGLAVVEACTDLDYWLGLDSNVAYAEAVVQRIYES
jgi:aspartate/glutamate racemase